ncbi:MAG TPA: YegS/Rv2252/BmrU family lipid kinase, partial [Chitinophagaceae bacterium]|nr:YegS/Rv2252/BmrU family lipid kinase [Chitinophagaceae bacterium]
MQRRIVYLINPVSGTREKKSLQKAIRRATEQEKLPYEIIHTNADGDYDFLKEKILNEKITDIVVCGGDGTISAIGGALIGIDVNTGIIPMGSGNGLALCAGIPKNARKALDIIFRGKTSYIDGFYINDRFSCMLSGIGLDAAVAHEFATQKKRGLKTYIKLTTRHFFSARPYLFRVSNAKNTIVTEAYFISIANSNQFGNNFKIAPKAVLSDGLLDIVIAKKMHKLWLLLSVLYQVTGFNTRKKDIIQFRTKELTIHNHSLAPLHVDGDPVETAALFRVNVIPEA